jgi:hypothetical protein
MTCVRKGFYASGFINNQAGACGYNFPCLQAESPDFEAGRKLTVRPPFPLFCGLVIKES